MSRPTYYPQRRGTGAWVVVRVRNGVKSDLPRIYAHESGAARRAFTLSLQAENRELLKGHVKGLEK